MMHAKDTDGMANSVNHDQTTQLGMVLSGFTQFSQFHLQKNSENIIYNVKAQERRGMENACFF